MAMENSQMPELSEISIPEETWNPDSYSIDSFFNYGDEDDSANNNTLYQVFGNHVDGGGLIHNDAYEDDEDKDKEEHYIHGITEEEYLDSLPSGFRFEPRDHELILDYLKKRINDEKMPHNLIKLVNLYQQAPYDLTARYPALGENRWYFFTPRDRKYQNGSRPNRAAGNGYWKATGKDRSIKLPGRHGQVIGFRKVLVFYDGKPKDSTAKTNWTMHEYRVNDSSKRVRTSMTDMRLDDYVLCKLILKLEKTINNNTRRRGGALCKIIREPENTYNQTLTTGGGGGSGGGGDKTTSINNDGADTSPNNSEEMQLHTINNADLEVNNSNRQQMINYYSPEDKFQINPLPPPQPPMGYYYRPSTTDRLPFLQLINDVEDTSMMGTVAVLASTLYPSMKTRDNPQNHGIYDTKWEIDIVNKAIDIPSHEFEDMHLDPSPDPQV